MRYLSPKFLTRSSLALFLFALAGCGAKEVKDDFINYRFDQQVINKLPVYDSLVLVIIENFPSFGKFIKDEDSYRSFRYMPASEDMEAYKKLPPEVAPKIDPYFARLGSDYIYGFDVFKDSSVKIYVRTRFSAKTDIDIMENLSYYPTGNIRVREFPERDTTLNKNWQYWARVDKRNLF